MLNAVFIVSDMKALTFSGSEAGGAVCSVQGKSTASTPATAASIATASSRRHEALISRWKRAADQSMLRYSANVLALVLATATIDPAPAQRIRAGLLTCDVSAGIGLILGSKKERACVVSPEGPGRRGTSARRRLGGHRIHYSVEEGDDLRLHAGGTWPAGRL